MIDNDAVWRAIEDDARHFTRYPIRALKPNWFALHDRRGNTLSFHRTISGALRARRQRLEEEA